MCILVEKCILCDTLQPLRFRAFNYITVCIHSRLWKKKKHACLQADSLRGVKTAAWPAAEKHSRGVSSHVIVGTAGCYVAAFSRDMVFPSGVFQRARTTVTAKKGSVNTCHPELNNIRQITKGRVRNTRLINAFDDVRLTFMFYLEHLDLFASGFTANKSQNTFHELHSQVWYY